MWNDSFPPTWKGRATVSVILIVACVLLVTVARVDPATSRRFPRCPFHELSGLHCPGCGSTRAIHEGLNGRLSRALSSNVLLVLAFPWFLYEFVSGCRFVATGSGLRPVRLRSAAGWAIVGLIGLFGIVRNLPLAPFQWLAP